MQSRHWRFYSTMAHRRFFQILGAVFTATTVMAGGSACTTSSSVSDDYLDAVHPHGHPGARGDIPSRSPETPSESALPVQTTVVFLVDGLAVGILDQGLRDHRLPAVASLFGLVSGRPSYRLGRASFPSLTYPNLVSILTGETVSGHGITGNRVHSLGTPDAEAVTNFEDVRNWSELRARLGHKTVFAQLADRGQTSISYSYPFPFDSTAHQSENLAAGLDYFTQDFAAVDNQTLSSLTTLLHTVPMSLWPRFIFVHLIGVDAYAHHDGPSSAQVQSYLSVLDEHLAPALDFLRAARSTQHPVSVVMTADHGFSPTNAVIPLRAVLKKLSPDIDVLSDNRVASVRLPNAALKNQIDSITEGLLSLPHVRWSIARHRDANGESHLQLYHSSGRRARIDLHPAPCRLVPYAARFQWLKRGLVTHLQAPAEFFCPEDFDLEADFGNDNFLISSLTEYFSPPAQPVSAATDGGADAENDTLPDIVVVPDMDADFTGGYKGNHGGLSAEEMLVPVLTWHAPLPDGVQAMSQLLRQLKLLR